MFLLCFLEHLWPQTSANLGLDVVDWMGGDINIKAMEGL